jgi:hypothetical protein
LPTFLTERWQRSIFPYVLGRVHGSTQRWALRMLSGMRYLIVVLVFISLACSKRDSRSETATETEARAAAEVGAVPALEADPRKAQLTWVEPPTVELIGAGKPPLRKVRWSFQEGAKEVLVVSTKQVHQMRGGSWDDRFVPTGIVQTIDFVTNAVSAEGIAEVAFHIRDVAELETPDANSPSLLGAEGWTGTYKVDSTGVIQDLVLVPSPGSKYAPPRWPRSTARFVGPSFQFLRQQSASAQNGP